jgi:tRNA uridine 5-carboxymethylaminomethyl modification enzyme
MSVSPVDVVVVGAGHAGIEAAVAAARLGCEVAVVTPADGQIGHMPCNPAIGGTAKGHLVREIDALGGVMGEAIDATGIQFKLLNRSRGPAVWSPRAQADKALYSRWVEGLLGGQPGLRLVRDRVVSLETNGNRVVAVVLDGGGRLACTAVVVTTGTFLNGLTHVGDVSRPEGRHGEAPSNELARCLRRLGLTVGRLKTGTPPRLHRDTIDFERAAAKGVFTEEAGDDRPVPFSFTTHARLQNQITCWSLYTNERVHETVRRNIGASPLYNGRITGIGPRYCPSLEDKVMRFPDRERHQIHLEPEGIGSESIYVNGLSMSLPAAAQHEVVHALPGLADSKVIRPGYAVEYDFVQPTDLKHTLECRRLSGLFLAGQVNGTSGYEEAAAQGLVAGINAARLVQGQGTLLLGRDESYIGILVDDLVSRGCLEPYRMFTSRAEHRLVLRIDNADLRLTPVGREIGLVSDQRWARFEERRRNQEANLRRLRQARVLLGTEIVPADRALKRPDVRLATLVERGIELALADGADGLDGRSLEAEIKYEGYIKQELTEIARVRREGARKIPSTVSFEGVPGLSRELAQRLTERRPETIANAARIPGMTPAALAVLHAHVGRTSRAEN